MNNDELAHYGVDGMKWGVRNYQNKDGSLTPLGREHYGIGKLSLVNTDYNTKKANAKAVKMQKKMYKSIDRQEAKDKKNLEKQIKESNGTEEQKQKRYTNGMKEITGAAYAAKVKVDQWAEAVYGDYSYADAISDRRYQETVEKGKMDAEANAKALDKALTKTTKAIGLVSKVAAFAMVRKIMKGSDEK